MSKDKKAIIEVQGATIIMFSHDNVVYISLTDIQLRSLASHAGLRALGAAQYEGGE